MKILNGDLKETNKSLAHIVNVYYPKPVTILELAKIVREAIMKHINNAVIPAVEIVDIGQPPLFNEDDKKKLKVDHKQSHKFSRFKSVQKTRGSHRRYRKEKNKTCKYGSHILKGRRRLGCSSRESVHFGLEAHACSSTNPLIKLKDCPATIVLQRLNFVNHY